MAWLYQIFQRRIARCWFASECDSRIDEGVWTSRTRQDRGKDYKISDYGKWVFGLAFGGEWGIAWKCRMRAWKITVVFYSNKEWIDLMASHSARTICILCNEAWYAPLCNLRLSIFVVLSFGGNKMVMIFTERVEKLVDEFCKAMI